MPKLDRNRLSPPLMYVFRAAHAAKDAKKSVDIRNRGGDRVIAGRRLRARQVITELILRREVSERSGGLVQHSRPGVDPDMNGAPYARKSILNFGLPDVSNRTIEGKSVSEIPGDIKTTISNYEPRLPPASLNVERDIDRRSGRAQGKVYRARRFDL